MHNNQKSEEAKHYLDNGTFEKNVITYLDFGIIFTIRLRLFGKHVCHLLPKENFKNFFKNKEYQ